MCRLKTRKISIIMVIIMALSVFSGTLSFLQITADAEATLQNIALLPTTVASAGNTYNIDTLNYPRDGIIADWNYWGGYLGTGVWYEYDLGREFDIKKIELVTKQDVNSLVQHRRNWEIIGYKDPKGTGTVLGAQGNTLVNPMATWTLDLTGTNNYRYIRMRKTAGGDEDMAIAELRVFADASAIPSPSPSPSISPIPTPTVNPNWENIATLPTTIATGGGTYKESEINYPRDGIVDSNIWGGYLVTGSWYEYDFGLEYDIRSVEVIPRQDETESTHHRQNWEIIGYKDPRGTGTVLGTLGGTPIPVMTTWRANLSGTNNYRYIRLHKTAGGEEDMAMTEFRVFVDPVPEPTYTPVPVSVTVEQADNLIVDKSNFKISGNTAGSAANVNIVLNGGTLLVLTGDVTSFSKILMLQPGSNTITIQASDSSGKLSDIITRNIQYDPPKPIAVDGDVFKIGGIEGTPIGSIQAGNITGCVNITNQSGSPVTPLLVVALYDGNKLSKITTFDNNHTPIQNNTTKLYYTDIDVTDSIINKNIKMFVWNSLDRIMPISDVITINQDVMPPIWPEVSILTASDVGATELTLSWTGASDDIGVTNYKVYKDLELLATVNGDKYSYRVTGLTPNTSYAFTLQAVDGGDNSTSNGPSVEITTLQDPSSLAFKFYVGSDTHVPIGTSLTYALQDATATGCSAIILNGDLTETGQEIEFIELKTQMDTNPHPPTYYVFGNHETRQQTGGMEEIIDRMMNNLGMPSYYYDTWINGYHFIMLNGEKLLQNASSISDTQFNWLKAKLAEGADANKPIFVFMHQPISLLENQSQIDTMNNILAEYPQVIFTNGHTHGSISLNTSGAFATLDDGAIKSNRAALFNVYGDKVVVNGRSIGATPSTHYTAVVGGPNITWLSNEISRANVLKTNKPIGDLANQYPQWAKDYLESAFSFAQAYAAGITTPRGYGTAINKLKEAEDVFIKSHLGQTAQYFTVSGTVYNQLNQVVSGTTVSIYTLNDQSTPIDTVTTKTDGSYTISTPLISGKYVLKANYYTESISTVIVPFKNVTNADIKIDPTVLTDTAAPVWQENSKLTATNINGYGLTLTWQAANDDTAVTSYQIYNGTTVIDAVAGDKLSYDITGLTPGTSYSFTVKAGDGSNNWSKNNPTVSQATSLEVAAPTWQGGALNASDIALKSLKLSWSGAIDDAGVTGYKIYNGSVLLATVDSKVTDFELKNLNHATQYSFSVQAGDASGKWSTNGPTKTVNTLNDTNAPTWLKPKWFLPPLCPASLLVASNLTPTSVDLKWLAPTITTGAVDNIGVTQYGVYKDGALYTTVAGTVNTCTVTGLTAGNSYTFTVQAGDASGNWSADGPTVTAVPSANIALGKTVTSSGGSTAEQAFDGLIGFSNGWSSNTSGSIWLQVDLGSENTIKRIEFEERPNFGYNSERIFFVIKASNDPTFATSATLATVGENATLDECPWIINITDSIPYRYVRYEKTQPIYSFVSDIRIYK